MKPILFFVLLIMSAITADAQLIMPYTPEAAAAEQQFVAVRQSHVASSPAQRCQEAGCDIVERPRFCDNWSFTFSGGVYHPNFFALKYLVDCSGLAGCVELRKQLTPIIGLGVEADGYYRMTRKERRDPRAVIGPALHVNLMNLFGGYNGRPRIFEIDALIKPAWGHLYRGVDDSRIPDENYFATKFGIDFNFNLGRDRQWTLALRPAVNLDVTSHAPIPGFITPSYDGYKWNRTDLQFYIGATYHFRGHGGKRHLRFAQPVVDGDEVERLNEVVSFLRDDVESRDCLIRELKLKVDSLEQQNAQPAE